MDWIPVADEKRTRCRELHGELGERALVRRGNAAYAAALALLMAGDGEAAHWFGEAAASWRESWDAGGSVDAWGRPIGAVKAALLAGDEEAVDAHARWALGLGTETAASPIGRYAAVLALLALARPADELAASLRGLDDFPDDVAAALEAIASRDADGYARAVASVVRSFETRSGYLEDVPVADTALVLAALARRAGIDGALPASATLPG